MNIEMTGLDDLKGYWKVAVCGFPGSGKTMLASTAKNPLMVFFSPDPKIKSIANRFIPHVKITNWERSDGTYITVQDQLLSLIMFLREGQHDYETLVIDTGDELQQALKEARRRRNAGEFAISDWGWLADTYREIILALLSLEMDVIVNYHIKTVVDEGTTFRELMLQGSSKDEAPGWFDEVWVIEAVEAADESGDFVTRRMLLSHPSRMYPWIKDHSGLMPLRYPVSQGFVGDLASLFEKLRAGEVIEGQERQVLESVPEFTPDGFSGCEVPTPEELDKKKKAKKEVKKQEKEDKPVAQPDDAPSDPQPKADTDGPAGGEGEQEAAGASIAPDEGSQQGESQPEAAATQEEAEQLLKEELGATEVPPEEVFKCADCGVFVDDADLRELTQIRFRAYLCRSDFKARLKKA